MLSCEKVLPGCAWLVLIKTGTSLYIIHDEMDNSTQIIRMDDHPYIKKWFRGYEYRLSIGMEGTLTFISLDGTEKVHLTLLLQSRPSQMLNISPLSFVVTGTQYTDSALSSDTVRGTNIWVTTKAFLSLFIASPLWPGYYAKDEMKRELMAGIH